MYATYFFSLIFVNIRAKVSENLLEKCMIASIFIEKFSCAHPDEGSSAATELCLFLLWEAPELPDLIFFEKIYSDEVLPNIQICAKRQSLTFGRTSTDEL